VKFVLVNGRTPYPQTFCMLRWRRSKAAICARYDVRWWRAPCKGGAFQWVQVPPGETLQPEAIGAVMEVTKWLKPSISVSRIGDSASVQAVTQVNAEQASKRTMRRPT
jgi:hypothetical protein